MLRADAKRLGEIGAEPEVARWWPGPTVEYITAKADGGDGVDAFAIEADDEPIGMAQCHEEPNPQYRHAAIDVFLTSTRHGQGLGSETVRALPSHWRGPDGTWQDVLLMDLLAEEL